MKNEEYSNANIERRISNVERGSYRPRPPKHCLSAKAGEWGGGFYGRVYGVCYTVGWFEV